MNSTIINAIRNRQLLSFTYDGYARVVEPHTYGETSAGKETVRAYQIEGGHVSGIPQPWHLFTVSKMRGLTNAGMSFPGPRPDYNRDDKAMAHIYAQL